MVALARIADVVAVIFVVVGQSHNNLQQHGCMTDRYESDLTLMIRTTCLADTLPVLLPHDVHIKPTATTCH